LQDPETQYSQLRFKKLSKASSQKKLSHQKKRKRGFGPDCFLLTKTKKKKKKKRNLKIPTCLLTSATRRKKQLQSS